MKNSRMQKNKMIKIFVVMLLALINWNVYGSGGDSSAKPEILQTLVTDSGVRLDLMALYKESAYTEKDFFGREDYKVARYLQFFTVVTVHPDSPIFKRFQYEGVPIKLEYQTNGSGVKKVERIVSQNNRIIVFENRSRFVARFIDPYFRNNGENTIDGESFYEITEEQLAQLNKVRQEKIDQEKALKEKEIWEREIKKYDPKEDRIIVPDFMTFSGS